MINFPEITSVIEIVLQAGKKVHEIYNSEFTVQMKGPGDPLTNADTEANTILTKGINEKFPEDGIFSEENVDDKRRLKFRRVWIIDPIDGTREFVAKRNEFCISVGLSIDNKSELGIILNPATCELFIGFVGFGIFFQKLNSDFILDLSKIHFQKKINDSSNQKVILVSRSEFESGLFSGQNFWEREYILKPTGSIAYKLALIALGFYPLTISLRPKNEWDICAGVALVEASGQIVQELTNLQDFKFNHDDSIRGGIIAGNPEFVKEFIKTHKKDLKISSWNK